MKPAIKDFSASEIQDIRDYIERANFNLKLSKKPDATIEVLTPLGNLRAYIDINDRLVFSSRYMILRFGKGPNEGNLEILEGISYTELDNIRKVLSKSLGYYQG